MVEVLSEVEGDPAAYFVVTGMSEAAVLASQPITIWRRIEGWITYRWGERTVTWVIEGPGDWTPRLRPATITAAEIWRGSAWESVTLDPAPTGYDLGDATYRVTATVGDPADPPENVQAAYRRLGEYMRAVSEDPTPGHSGGRDGDYSFERPAEWAARAMQLSGAGDLLRAYR